MEIPLLDLVAAVLFCLYSLLMIKNGWNILRNGEKIVFFPQKMGILIIRMLQGAEAASRRENEITTPSKMKWNGVFAIIGGTIFIIAGVMFLLDTLSRTILGNF